MKFGWVPPVTALELHLCPEFPILSDFDRLGVYKIREKRSALCLRLLERVAEHLPVSRAETYF